MATQSITNAHRREGLNILRKIISTHPNISHSSQTATGLTTSELYKLALKEKPSEEFRGWKEWAGTIRGPRNASAAPTSSKTGVAARRGGKNPTASGVSSRTDVPPHPEHPIRSMSYLKQEILPVLESSKEIKITCTTRVNASVASPNNPNAKAKASNSKTPSSSTVWVWKAVDKSKLPRRPVPKPPREVLGTDVGLGADWTHLNTRRLRARKRKVYEEVGIVRRLDAQKKAEVGKAAREVVL